MQVKSNLINDLSGKWNSQQHHVIDADQLVQPILLTKA
jgi:hypothetical protein